MIGRVILETRMRSKNFFTEDQIFSMKPKDVISMETVWTESNCRYLVIKVNKKLKSIDLLPLEEFYTDEKKQEAEDLISKTLLSADLVTYVLDRAKRDPKAAKVFREELNKRLAKTSRSE